MADLSERLAATVRNERGRIVGGLVRLCGSLDAAEEAFQEATLSALEAWRERAPDNPGAWLTTAAKNHARDAARRRQVAETKAPLLAGPEAVSPDDIDVVSDDSLRLILACCHPALSRESQIALTLKVICGLSTEDVARAFVTTDDTVAQRILRAKQRLGELAGAFELPARDELAGRLEGALGVVYALFNAGHVAREGGLMRVDLQAEALRLARLLCDLVPRAAEAFGLLAILAFGAARAATRVDGAGLPVLLDAQDRVRWDRELLREGLIALFRARGLAGRGAYLLQAEIAALHMVAPRFERTDWAAIVAAYDALAALDPSPVVALNRAIALGFRDGPEAGLAALVGLEEPLAAYPWFFAARADLLARSGADPLPDLRRAHALATNDAERALLASRITPSAGAAAPDTRRG